MQQWMDEALLLTPKVLTPHCLARMVPACHQSERWAEPLQTQLSRAGIESDHDVALFLAQAGHESASFRELEESLNYGEEALEKLFGRHRISLVQAGRFGRNAAHPADEEALGNLLYGGIWGERNLGNTQPGDGYRYRGRGIFQLTGRANYTACSRALGVDLLRQPERLSDAPEIAVASAVWFWTERVTGGDIKTTTREINGGYHGLADRVERFKRALKVLEE